MLAAMAGGGHGHAHDAHGHGHDAHGHGHDDHAHHGQGWNYRNWDPPAAWQTNAGLAITTFMWWWIFHGQCKLFTLVICIITKGGKDTTAPVGYSH